MSPPMAVIKKCSESVNGIRRCYKI